MSLSSAAADYDLRQRRLAREYRTRMAAAWRRVDPRDIAASWRRQIPRLMLLLTAAQEEAAAAADGYVTGVLAAQELGTAASGAVVASALSGIASDGRPLDTLLYQPADAALTAIQGGSSTRGGLALGRNLADMIARTQVADAGRVAVGVASATRPATTGYVRMLSGASCSRCIVLAGRWYRTNTGFQRHPRCDCRHIPSRENLAGDIRTDPRATFASMSRAEQDRVFTADGAEAIRSGADIYRVVNARRGAAGLAPAGRRLTADEIRMLRGGRDRGRLELVEVGGRLVYATREGVRKGRPFRLMPESIAQVATDHADYLRLLRVHGYIT